ncbi:DegT/DnrJ/EryC1/StrS aminotransferase family protein [uncultured Ruegeria sp.]|uniref:DegT/DnrJ/EryC1/StrS family aminotransferase n=1 Tax=uncultured Ruegeria sp. TaxID=259304 RepID=UPI0026050AE9|nr:DegT/DnrJ/EryC1/StrS family aminotransferase [uncultured Ruegeria sp.]
MTVPFLNLNAAYEEVSQQIESAALNALRSGCFIGGPEVGNFETLFAAYCQADHAVSVANGLEALEIALHAFDIGPGDEVIVPTNTFIATWFAVARRGATIVPVEPDAETYNITVEAVAESLTTKTRAVIPVHLYGQPADIDGLMALAEERNLIVIEDAAQCHGARCRGQRIGATAHAATWSFYPSKNLGAFGDGGAITTNDTVAAERMRLLRNYGSNQKYVHDLAGTNSRLDPIQAAMLAVKLPLLDEWNMRRQKVADLYLTGLSDTNLILPKVADWATPVWHLFVVRHPERENLMNALRDRGVDTLIHYPIPPHRQSAFAHLGFERGRFPISEQLAQDVFSLPMGPHLHLEHVERVILAFKELVA